MQRLTSYDPSKDCVLEVQMMSALEEYEELQQHDTE